MRHSQIEVTTYDDNIFQGMAVDITVTAAENRKDKEELLVIKADQVTHQVRLTDIKKLEAIGNVEGRHDFIMQWR